jgi:hypothetical protein
VKLRFCAGAMRSLAKTPRSTRGRRLTSITPRWTQYPFYVSYMRTRTPRFQGECVRVCVYVSLRVCKLNHPHSHSPCRSASPSPVVSPTMSSPSVTKVTSPFSDNEGLLGSKRHAAAHFTPASPVRNLPDLGAPTCIAQLLLAAREGRIDPRVQYDCDFKDRVSVGVAPAFRTAESINAANADLKSGVRTLPFFFCQL